MKRKVIILVAIAAFLLPTPALAWYYAIGLGTGGEAEENSLTWEFGKEDLKIKNFNVIAGVTIPLIFHGDGGIPDDTSDSSCPHDDCDSKGSRTDGTEYGLLGRFGMEIKNYETFVSLIAGFTQSHVIDLEKSNVTQDYYKKSDGFESNMVYGIGVSYTPTFFEWKLKMIFSLDLDNRRGITALIGWRW
jgi:hypothetical protein